MRKMLGLVAVIMLMLLLMVSTQAAEPLRIEATVDKTSVKVGDKITVNWTLLGGVPPYEFEMDWNALYSIDAFQDFTGDKGTGSMTVEAGMVPVIKFHIRAKDSQMSYDQYYSDPVVLSSDDLGLSIQNQDSWRYPGDTAIVLDRTMVKTGIRSRPLSCANMISPPPAILATTAVGTFTKAMSGASMRMPTLTMGQLPKHLPFSPQTQRVATLLFGRSCIVDPTTQSMTAMNPRPS